MLTIICHGTQVRGSMRSLLTLALHPWTRAARKRDARPAVWSIWSVVGRTGTPIRTRQPEKGSGAFSRRNTIALLSTFALEGGLDWSPTARVIPILYFIFKGGLVDPRLRASNEHILIVRVPRAGGQPGYPSLPSATGRCTSTRDRLVCPLLLIPSLLILSSGMGAE